MNGPEIVRLLQEHLDHMYALTPAESVHALDLDELKSPDITFWTAWDGPDLLGCGAIKAMDAVSGEIKSMRTAEAHRGRGVGTAILQHIIDEAISRGYHALVLETGSMAEFAPARSLYERFGFDYCGPFGDYCEDPHSVFMIRQLER